jgi:ketosteroid isomerase-like protein
MSQKNVEISRALIEHWNDGERSSLLECLDPAAELQSPLSSVVGEPYRGHAGFQQWLADLEEQFAEWRITPEDVRDLGEQVMTISRINARGRSSDVELEFRTAVVVRFGNDDRVTSARIYADVDEALKAVGLEE